ncbi:MAG: single-stranded DNA-binding protein [Planctomycetes bacterium]|nr:single-stranded DNA-binding protein [Planctomycetota bacterium]MBL7007518.1 single-stranded DNA-binding protein [Planctomycetota bacterium]
MASFNKVILMGNLTRDPEVRQAQSGTYVVRCALAVNERIPDGEGGYRDETHFFDFVVFGKQAESFSKWFTKGRPVLIEGKLRQDRWEDRETGKKRSKVEVVCDRWHFVGGKEDARGDGSSPAVRSAAPSAQADPGFPARDDFVPDDVPF